MRLENDFAMLYEHSNRSYSTALKEIRSGKKKTHWIWYVFPQLKTLSKTSLSKRLALHSVHEAIHYLNDDVLGPRLIEITREVFFQLGTDKDVKTLMGSELDAYKLLSSMTLFYYAAKKYGHSSCPLFSSVMKICQKHLNYTDKVTIKECTPKSCCIQ